MLSLAFVVLALFAAGRTASAQTLQTCDEAGLDAALALSGVHTFDCSGPTVIVTSATKGLASPTTVTLDGGGLLTISGGGTHRVFNVATGASLRLENLTVTNGFASAGDGGAITNSGTLELFETTVSTSTAASGGGGGIKNAGTLLIGSGSIVTRNVASVGAGGGVLNSTGTVTVDGGTVSDNASVSSGGGMYNVGGLTVVNSAISGNSGTSGGGIYHAGGGQVAIDDSSFTASDATLLDGGGLYAVGGTMQITGGVFDRNSATRDGGAVYADLTTSIDLSTITNNSAGRWDGA